MRRADPRGIAIGARTSKAVTAVLVTRFMSEEGVAEVVDFMPVSDQAHSTEHHRLVRIVRVVRGQRRLEFELFPAFDYGRAGHQMDLGESGVIFRSPAGQLTLHIGGGPARCSAGSSSATTSTPRS